MKTFDFDKTYQAYNHYLGDYQFFVDKDYALSLVASGDARLPLGYNDKGEPIEVRGGDGISTVPVDFFEICKTLHYR